MVDDRICIFYVANYVEDICKEQRKLKEKLYEGMEPLERLKNPYPLNEAEKFLKELNHNIGVNVRLKKAEAGEKAAKQMLEHYKPERDLPKKKRGRPRKNP